MSVSARHDEEAPLLGVNKPLKTPLPWFRLSIVLFLQLAEPLTSNVIYPFAPQLIRDVGITHGDETKVGYFVGLMSMFFLTQAMTVLHWGRLSDRIGRKPVILSGLFGLSLSMFCFGLSRTFWGAVISRSLNGALNGNIGVIKSMVGEMTDSTNIATAFGMMPLAWSTGCALGPLIGGSLSHPADRFPDTFGQSKFHRTFPYFLACAIPASFTALAWLVAFCFLKETLPYPTPFSHLLISRSRTDLTAQDSLSRGTAPTGDSPATAGGRGLSHRVLLTRRVITAAGTYASVSFLDICVRAIQPVFWSTPISLGGLGLSPPEIGKILSCYGIVNGLAQVLFFARVHDRFGAKRVLMASVISALPVFAIFPITNVIARTYGLGPIVWCLIGVQVSLAVLFNFSYGTVFIFITAAAPTPASIGATNGLAQMFVSAARAIGPATANSLFSFSIESGILGGWLVYYALLLTTCIGIYVASLLPKQAWAS